MELKILAILIVLAVVARPRAVAAPPRVLGVAATPSPPFLPTFDRRAAVGLECAPAAARRCCLDLAAPERLVRRGAAALPQARRPVLRPRKLRDLVWETLGKQIQVMGTAHSPIEDAIATMDLYKAERTTWENSLTKQIHPTRAAKSERASITSRFRKVAIQPVNHSYYCHSPHALLPQTNTNIYIQPSGPPSRCDSFIPEPQPIGGTYHQSSSRFPTMEERLAAARVAQQQARFRASAALRYQTMMQNVLNTSTQNRM